jgi:hypothetical protein
MSTETPETKNPWQARREAVDRAVKAWQTQEVPSGPAPGGGRYVDATLEDCLNDEGLIVLPRSTGHGKWIVEVDGKPAPLVGSDRLSGPVDAEEAADLFLTVTSADYYNAKNVTIRPATDDELVGSLYRHIIGGGA